MSRSVANPTIKVAVPVPLYERTVAEAARIGVTIQQLTLMALVDRLDARVSEGEHPPDP